MVLRFGVLRRYVLSRVSATVFLFFFQAEDGIRGRGPSRGLGYVYKSQALRFAEVYGARDTLGLLELFCSMEKWKRSQFAPVLAQFRQLLADALETRQGAGAPSQAARAIAEGRTDPALLSACQAVQSALDDCWANVGSANICAGLFVQLS